ncbi:MAG: VOC family protein [Pseudomonadota bacterium]
MGDAERFGHIAWHDITVPDAPALRDFYTAVVGWKAETVSMGSYADFNMVRPTTGEPAAGVCHARGENADLPPQWLMYIVVADLDTSLEACIEYGGQVVRDSRPLAGGRFAVVADPAGAITALFEEP